MKELTYTVKVFESVTLPGVWVAMSKEVDICAQGKTEEEALLNWQQSLFSNSSMMRFCAVQNGTEVTPIPPCPDEIWEKAGTKEVQLPHMCEACGKKPSIAMGFCNDCY
jgi:hypothetical protein